MYAYRDSERMFAEVRRRQYASARRAWAYILLRRPGYLRYLLPRLLSLQPGRSAILDRRPWLTFPAIRWLEGFLTSEMHIFEWGMGGSTLFFAERAKHVISIEHDKEWFQQVSGLLQGEHLSNVEARLIEPDPEWPAEGCAAISESGPWKGRSFKQYASAIEVFDDEVFDVVLVDGRARPACLRVAVSKVRNGGALVLDNSEYERYRSTLESLDRALAPDWVRKDLWGPLPYGVAHMSCTTVWLRGRAT